MSGGDWTWSAGREMAGGRKLRRRLAWHGGGRAQAPGGARCRSLRQVSGARGKSTRERPAQSAGHLFPLCDAGPDDHFDQRAAVYRLQEVRVERGWGDRMRGFLGPRIEDRRAQPIAAVLCRAALWRGAGRGDVDGAATIPSRQSDFRHETACQKRAALSDRALWYPERCARRHERILREEVTFLRSPTPSLRAKRSGN